MTNILKKAALVAALATASVSAHAAEANIKVWALVDPTLALLKEDGSALPDSVKLSYNPVSGLSPYSEQVRIHSNDITKDVVVSLGNTAELLPENAGVGATAEPLTVKLNGTTLTTAAQDFTKDMFVGGVVPGASIAMEFRVEQATRRPITVAGTYGGIINVVLAQKP